MSQRPDFAYRKLKRAQKQPWEHYATNEAAPPIEGFNSYEFAWLLAEEIRALRFPEDETEPISETEALDIGLWFTNEYGIRWGLAQIAHMIGRSRERVRQIEEHALERLAKSEPAQLLKLLQPSDRAAHWSDTLEGGDDLDGVSRHVHHQYMKLFGTMELSMCRKRRWQEKTARLDCV